MIKKMTKNVKILIVLILSLIGISLFYFAFISHSDKIYPGVKVSGISLSNLNLEQAKLKLSEGTKPESDKITFDLDGEKYFVTLEDLGYKRDMEKALKEAFETGRNKSSIENFFRVVSLPILQKNINMAETFEDKKVENAINYLVDKVYRPALDARLSFKEGNFSLEGEKDGRYLDAKDAREKLKNDVHKKEELVLKSLPIYPKVKKDYFSGIDGLLSRFSTDYSRSEKNRKENISLASSSLKGLLIKPGQEISFNGIIGDISEDKGYKNAGVIINGEFDRGLGGGICQVSTTLYNALARADIEILERSNHSRPVNYVDMGTDAAVATGFKDLKFKNNLSHPIYIDASTDGRILEFLVFGNKGDLPYEINLRPVRISVSEPESITKYSDQIPEGEVEVEKRGSKGYYYETYKDYIKDGKVLKSEKISNSNYISQNRVVIIGEGEKTSKKNTNNDEDSKRENKKKKNKIKSDDSNKKNKKSSRKKKKNND